MPVACRSEASATLLYSASRSIRARFTAKEGALQFASIRQSQRSMSGSGRGQSTSGRCFIASHFSAFSGTPGPAQGEAKP